MFDGGGVFWCYDFEEGKNMSDSIFELIEIFVQDGSMFEVQVFMLMFFFDMLEGEVMMFDGVLLMEDVDLEEVFSIEEFEELSMEKDFGEEFKVLLCQEFEFDYEVVGIGVIDFEDLQIF